MKSVLNVGGGNKSIPISAHFAGWKHDLLDIDSAGNPNIVLDAREISTLPAESYDAVFCAHNLEHYHRHDAAKVVQGFRHVLKGDGFAEVYVPDLKAVMQEVASGRKDIDDVLYESPSGSILVRDALYGFGKQIEKSGQEYFAHKTGFTPKSLTEFMRTNGFPFCVPRQRGEYEIGGLFYKSDPKKSEAVIERPKTLKFIAFCVPSLGTVSLEWAEAFATLSKNLPNNYGSVNFLVRDRAGGEIAENRNRCVQLAIEYEKTVPNGEITHLMWLDDDVLFPRTLIGALLRHNRDIASGVYFTKDPVNPEPLIFPNRGGGHTPYVPDTMVEAWGHGMGMALVRLEVYKRMAREVDLGKDKNGRPCWYRTLGAQDAQIEGNVIWMGGTEDLYFLDAAVKLGYKPLVDCSKAAFGWHFDKQSAEGFPQKQWKQLMSREQVVWDTPNGPQTWK